MNLLFKLAETQKELEGILDLQAKNLIKNISQETSVKEGFVTVQHDMDILRKMNDKCPHIISKYDDKVIGYALVMLRDFKNDIPLLRPMFAEIDKNVSQTSYFAMGQICIDKEYRKQGVFRGLYNYMKTQLKDEYSMVITEVDKMNTRSLNAHRSIGFKHLKSYYSLGQNWELIYWDWS